MNNGDRIGPYEIRDLLGEGGMASVYKAWHTGLHRFEAVKVPRGNGGAPDLAFVQRLLNEARTAAALHHPHIVAIHNVSELTAPLPYFSMDFVEGRDLSKILAEQRRFALAETIEILEPIAAALDHAHQSGVVHRDVKPANILLTRRDDAVWHAKIGDFGISRAAEEDDDGATKLTKSGMIVGTPEYMSPEQSGSGEPLDFRTDIYSLGVVAYEMLCGAPPFTAGAGVSRLSILISHVRDTPRALAGTCSGVSQSANDAILKALEKSPAARFQSCGEFLAALKNAGENSAVVTPFDAEHFAPLDARTLAVKPGEIGANGTLPPVVPNRKTAVLEPEIPVETAPIVAPRRSKSAFWAALGGILAGGLLMYAFVGQGDPEPSLPAAKTALVAPIEPTKTIALPPKIKAPVEPTERVETDRQMRDVPFETQTRRSANRLAGTKFVLQKGQNGQRETTWSVTYRGEQEVARKVVSSKVLKNSRPEIIVLGTKAAPKPKPVYRPRTVYRPKPISKPAPRPVSKPKAKPKPKYIPRPLPKVPTFPTGQPKKSAKNWKKEVEKMIQRNKKSEKKPKNQRTSDDAFRSVPSMGNTRSGGFGYQ